MSDSAALRLRDVRKSFGSLAAVAGLSLDVRVGEVFGLLGPNGAGKSTTMAMAVGVLVPDAGSVEVSAGGAGGAANGVWRSPTEPGARRALGFAPQALALYEELTAAENLAFFGRLYGVAGDVLRGRVGELLRLTGLQERARDRVRTFSGGMKRRLNLAAALVHEPGLVFLDEPTAGVDPQSRNAIFEFVHTLRAAGKTIVYTTHYMEEAQRLCDRVGIIDHGRLLALDTVPELVRMHGGQSVVTVQIEADGGTREERVLTSDPAGELVRLLARPGVRGAAVDRPSLEAVFLTLTGRRLRD